MSCPHDYIVQERTPMDVSSSSTLGMSQRFYICLLSAIMLGNIPIILGITQLVMHNRPESQSAVNLLSVLAVIGYTVGREMTAVSKSNGFFAVGYALTVTMQGVVAGTVIYEFDSSTTVKLLFINGILAVTLGVGGVLMPYRLPGIVSWTVGGIAVITCSLFVAPLANGLGLAIRGVVPQLGWPIVIGFCSLALYDWNQVLRLPHSARNAIKVVGSVSTLGWVRRSVGK